MLRLKSAIAPLSIFSARRRASGFLRLKRTGRLPSENVNNIYKKNGFCFRVTEVIKEEFEFEI